MDAVQQANSGHPGTPMALAPVAYVLWDRHLRHNPRDPQWPNRDRFVLSAGHASMLLYALLHLTGYDLPIEELKRFRQWNSKTPGHPEYGLTPGVETTTGPLGQGVANSVGMSMAEAWLAAHFNRPGYEIVDYRVYPICSDASGKALNAIASHVPWLVGGSADLAPSTKTQIADGGDFEAGSYGGRNLHFGVREHAMGAILNGMALEKLRVFGSTFLIFSDYMRAAIRLSALMDLPVLHLFTHDSIGVGEDGPTRAPFSLNSAPSYSRSP